ncbi:protein translocase subunit SecD [Bremerella cremea]|nr:protein translocase subunit SecD [Bremerella cremea]
MQKSCTIFAVMLVLTLTVTLLPGVDFGLDAGGSSWLGSTAMAQSVPSGDVAGPTIEVTPVEAPASEGNQTLNVLLVIALAIVLPYFLGVWIAKAIRLPDLGQRLGITMASLVFSVAICVLLWPPRLGIDLQGGIILIYEVDEEASLDLLTTNAAAAGDTSALGQTNAARLKEGTAQLIQQLQKRINPSGVSEVVIRPYGENQVEVQIPLAESADLDSIKRRITKAGVLDFMILANSQDHEYLMTRAQDESQLGTVYVTDREGNRIGRWVRVEKDQALGIVGDYNPNATDLTPMINGSRHMVRGGGPGQMLETLMKVEPPEFQLGGSHLSSASVTRDNSNGSPAIAFSFNVDGTRRMGHLSQNNLTEPNIPRKLGIVMDNVLISAPRINAVITDSGIITGDFTQQEASDLAQVLRAGKLPVVLRKEPISEQTISATLGDDTVRKGAVAITISLIAVLVFMVIYYRVAGLIACFALLFNLVLIMAVLIPFADLTLPGIAGLVLTVGMSVDANVLIFERIREELKSGASLKVALNNGFSKAMSTIVDANITTLITAVVLYRIGTDQIRGFAVTLFIGILMSMFTAIYVSRGFFDILERKRLIKTLNFMPAASSIGYDFIGKQKVAGIVSLIVILVGLIGVGARGKSIFDIDFNGGSSVQIYLAEAMPISEVRSKLTDVLPDLTVSAVTLEGAEDRIYKVDTSLAEYGELGKVVMTDRKGKSAEVDLTGINSLNQIIEALDAADVGIAVGPNADTDGIEFTDATNSPEGEMSVKNADDKTNTASNLRMNFSTDALRYNTGMIPAGVDVVQDRIKEVFTGPNGESLLVMHNMDFSLSKEAQTATPSTATDAPQGESKPAAEEKPAAPEGSEQSLFAPASSSLFAMLPWQVAIDGLLLQDEETPEKPMEEAKPADEAPAEEAPAEPKPADEKPADEKPADEKPADEKPADEKPADEKPADEKPAEPMAETPMTQVPATEVPAAQMPISGTESMFNVEVESEEKPRFPTETELSFDEGISADTVRTLIEFAADDLAMPQPEVALLDSEGNLLPADSRVSQKKWAMKLSTSPADSEKILEQVSLKLDSTPVWPSSSKIGSKVAGDMQTMAVSAILFCLIGIVGYIWFRFQSVAFGVAAVVALIHDVLVTLGAIALSLWLAPAFGFLQITEFKISLPVVAAFLTIIGYSLNDTIVIFDRIREVRGKDPHLTPEMVNLSINQTLGRTLLTSLTTLIVVAILYFIGGEGIHSFSFSLVVGVIAGTYSTIFIACPVLLWLMNREQSKAKA